MGSLDQLTFMCVLFLNRDMHAFKFIQIYAKLWANKYIGAAIAVP